MAEKIVDKKTFDDALVLCDTYAKRLERLRVLFNELQQVRIGKDATVGPSDARIHFRVSPAMLTRIVFVTVDGRIVSMNTVSAYSLQDVLRAIKAYIRTGQSLLDRARRMVAELRVPSEL